MEKDKLNISLSMMEYIQNQLQETPPSLQEARNLLQEVGPVRNYIITFTDPDDKISSILGLNKDNLELAEWISEEGSVSVFWELTDSKEPLEPLLDVMFKNGFRISLGQRAILGIESSDAGDVDDQRLAMLLGLVASHVEIREPKTNNHTAVVPLRIPPQENIVSTAYTTEGLVPDSFIRAYLKPEYDGGEVSDAMQEIVPDIKFWITGRTLVIPIDDLKEHLKSFYGY